MKSVKFILAILLALAVLSPGVVTAEDAPESDDAAGEAGAARLTRPPELVEAPEAEYTAQAVEAGVEGAVNLRLTISATGVVSKVEVLNGLGYGLDEAAVEAAEGFVFTPAEVNNQPAAVTLDFEVEFSLPIMPSTFKGEVVDLEEGSPVEQAQVSIEYIGEEYDPAPRASTAVKEGGAFSFENVPPGEYRVEISAPSYPARQETIELGSAEAVEVTYRLTPGPVNLRGEVREAGTRVPLAGIEVRVLDADSGEEVARDYTDAEAVFALRDLPPGAYQVLLAAEGYEALDSDVEVVEGEVTSARFSLRAEYYDEYTVKTTARQEQTEISRQRIELDELRRIPGSGGDVVRVVQNLPGVARPSFVSGSLVVRGSAPKDTKVFLQGDNIPLVFHFLGGPAVISSEMLDAVDFYPGNFSPYYGRATGGIVALRTRSPRDDRFHGFAEIDLLDATAQFEGPVSDTVSMAVSARRSYIDTMLPLLAPKDLMDQVTVSPRYYDYQGWLTWRASEENTLEFFVYGSDDALATVFDQEDGPIGDTNVQIAGASMDNLFHRGQVRWAWKPIAEPLENEFLVSFGLNRAGFDLAENMYFFADYYQSQIREDLKIKASDQFQLRVGADLQLGFADYRLQTPRIDIDRADGNSGGEGMFAIPQDGLILEESAPILQPAFYVEANYRPHKSLQLLPGIRADHYGAIGRTSISPRFTTRYSLSDELLLKGGVGLFTQPPLPHESDKSLGNPEVNFESAMHYALGTEWRPLDYLEVDATLFYRSMHDLVTSTAEVQRAPDGELEDVVFDNAGQGRAYGLELMLRHHPQNRFFGWLAYTLSRSERLDLKTDNYEPFQYDQTHILTAVAGYNLPWQVDISGRFRLVTGSPYTPVAGSVWDADQDAYQPIYGAPLSARSATFHQLDVRVDKKFVFDDFIFGVYVEVLNAYNAVNEEGKQYNFDYSDSGPVSGLPIIPTLGVNGRF